MTSPCSRHRRRSTLDRRWMLIHWNRCPTEEGPTSAPQEARRRQPQARRNWCRSLRPNGLEKLTAGQQVNVTWRTNGLTGTVAPVQNVIALDSPSAYYRLGESSGTTAVDASGNGLSATYVAGPTLGVSGSPVGGSDTAVQFNGTNQYVRLPNGFNNFSAGLTLEVWAYPTAAGNNARFFDLGNGIQSDNIIFGRSGRATISLSRF